MDNGLKIGTYMLARYLDLFLLFLTNYSLLLLTWVLGRILGRSVKMSTNSILFLENFPLNNAGYQYRAKKWAELLNQNGFYCEVLTCATPEFDFSRAWSSDEYFRFYVKNISLKFRHCIYARKFQTVVVRRELLMFNDYGNLFMEKFLLKIHPNVILDFDDDIAAAKNQPKKISNWYGKLLLEDGNKFNNSLKLYKRFIVASDYLKQKVLHENPCLEPIKVLVIPTCVDYDKYPGKHYPDRIEEITFGWIGGDHNYHLLDTIIPILDKLASNHKFKLLVIGGQLYKRNCNFEIEFQSWSLETEVANLYKIDVGLMPLKNNATAKGKGGFKLIQYMGLGIVSIANDVTINSQIINHENNSFLVRSEQDWFKAFYRILNNEFSLSEMGCRAKEKIHKHYTFAANLDKYMRFISSG